MKRCNACDEEFEDEISCSPLDATPLDELAVTVVSELPNAPTQLDSYPQATSRRGFYVTLIDHTSLLERLARELRFLVHQLKQAWPALRDDPGGFTGNALLEARRRLRRTLSASNSRAAITAAMLVLVSAAMILIFNDRLSKRTKGADQASEDPARILTFLPEPDVNQKDPGIGAGSKGRVGLANGKGEGSAPEPRKSTGGGSGGLHDPLPAQQGRVPPPSPLPAPIPKFPPVQKQTLPDAGIDIDPALWQNLPMALYGDPRSKSSVPSNGPGNGAGMGTVNGSGIGEGNGAGFGPGQDGNIGGGPKGPPGGGGIGGGPGTNPDPDRVYPTTQVTERARVLAKPEPQYTEDARRNQITGSVVLRVVFSRNGEVTNIRALQALPFGLTERAIAAARSIRFRPATKDGRPVNVSMQLEYNFNLY